MMEIFFWILMAIVFYTYAGYPALIYGLSVLFNRPVKKSAMEPSVSIIISAWNEGDVMRRRLHNFLNLDYPHKNIEILIGSDGSDDDTTTIIHKFNDARVRLFEYQERRGKMAVLNDLMQEAKNEVLVFTDARQVFGPKAIRELVANFSDPKVGCVSGELSFVEAEGGVSKGVGLYWKYEKFIRKSESRIHSMLGATGAIYALRKELASQLPRDLLLDDMYLPLKALLQGYRVIFDGTAQAFDRVAQDAKEEFRRKVRTLAGNFQLMTLLPQLLNPLKCPVVFQLVSHKILRLIIPYICIALFVLNVLLLGSSLFGYVFALQVVFYVLALGGTLLNGKNGGMFKYLEKACYLPYVFCMLNYAAIMGLLRFLSGAQNVRWDKARQAEEDNEE